MFLEIMADVGTELGRVVERKRQRCPAFYQHSRFRINYNPQDHFFCNCILQIRTFHRISNKARQNTN